VGECTVSIASIVPLVILLAVPCPVAAQGVLGAPSTADRAEFAAPSVAPGDTSVFPVIPDLVDGSVDSNLSGFSSDSPGETPLKAFSFGIAPLARASSKVFQYHEFVVPESLVIGTDAGNVLVAGVSGSVEVRGFLFAMGGASAAAGVNLKLLDVTDDPFAPVLVWSRKLASYRQDNFFSGSVGGVALVGGEGGFPYVGVSVDGGLNLSMSISPKLQLVRDSVAFGADLLLRRGRTYRLQVELSTSTQNRVLAATAIASFSSTADGAPVCPNESDPDPDPSSPGAQNSWLSLLTDSNSNSSMKGSISSVQLPKSDADSKIGSVLMLDRNVWEQGLLNPFNKLAGNEMGKMVGTGKFI
jgi:hypothetical protein